MKFRIFSKRKLLGRRWYWHCRSKNGRIIMAGESSGFHNKADAVSIVADIRRNAAYAKVEIEGETP